MKIAIIGANGFVGKNLVKIFKKNIVLLRYLEKLNLLN